MGLMPHDRVVLIVDEITKLLVGSREKEVLKTIGADAVRIDASMADQVITAGESTYRFGVEKV
jgi:hypothetical protein